MAFPSQTKLYREQHDRLRAQAAKMLAATSDAEHRQLLAQFAGQVMMHLKGEDDSLYPRLLSHPDPQVRAKAKELQASMGGLAMTFKTYYEKWIASGAIARDTRGYEAEMRAVIRTFAERMDLEDRELYDLADRALAA
ncbi:MAG TPA: hemerythrin domain-containing protein [Candidatus Elarobacter sp.]|nr:hemerythrin domain-containing protein [Candidatus Elarobacter sp.]